MFERDIQYCDQDGVDTQEARRNSYAVTVDEVARCEIALTAVRAPPI
jgi:hypothetical protein